MNVVSSYTACTLCFVLVVGSLRLKHEADIDAKGGSPFEQQTDSCRVWPGRWCRFWHTCVWGIQKHCSVYFDRQWMVMLEAQEGGCMCTVVGYELDAIVEADADIQVSLK